MPVVGVVEEKGRRGAEELSVDWKIPNFQRLLDGEDDDLYWSPEFGFCDVSWYLRMWPNWEREEGNPASGRVAIDLVRCDGGPPSTLRFSVGIRGSGGVEKSREGEKEFKGDGYYYAWYDFCSRSELLQHRTRLMPEDTFTIRCVLKRPGAAGGVCSSLPSTQVAPTNRIQSSDKQDAYTQTDCNLDAEVFSGVKKSTEKRDSSTQTFKETEEDKALTKGNQSLEKEGTEELKKSLKRLLVSGKDTDVVIKVQGKEFPVHRLILQSRSPVFEAMFAHDTAEKQRGVVNMEECDPESFPAFLNHVYTGSVGMISSGNVFSLHAASEKYDLQTLKRACVEFVKNNLTVASFCDAVTLANKYDEKELTELATEFFCCNSLGICKTVEWQIFLKENTTVGNELLIKAFSK